MTIIILARLISANYFLNPLYDDVKGRQQLHIEQDEFVKSSFIVAIKYGIVNIILPWDGR